MAKLSSELYATLDVKYIPRAIARCAADGCEEFALEKNCASSTFVNTKVSLYFCEKHYKEMRDGFSPNIVPVVLYNTDDQSYKLIDKHTRRAIEGIKDVSIEYSYDMLSCEVYGGWVKQVPLNQRSKVEVKLEAAGVEVQGEKEPHPLGRPANCNCSICRKNRGEK